MLKIPSEQIQQKSLCPSHDFVPVQDLGIPPNLGLLLTDGSFSESEEKPVPLFLYQPAAKLPGKPFNLNMGKTMQGLPASSPDGEFLKYLQYDKGQPARTLVVQSVDGKISKIVLERNYPFGYSTWIDNRHILWQEVLDPEYYWSFGERADLRDYLPSHLIDVKTLQTQELPPIQFPNEYGEYIVQGFIHNETENYAYLQHNTTEQVAFEIYSYATQTSQPVFTWLPIKFLQDPMDTSTFFTSNNRLNFIAMDGHVFWIMSQISVEQALSGPAALAEHVIEFTFPEEITPSFIPYYFDTKNAFLFIHANWFADEPSESVPENLYRLDVDSQTVYDYCFDIQRWRGRASISISPGEDFVAVTLYQDPMTGRGKKDTVLINLSTGDRAVLPDYQVFDWVTVKE